ncbi:C40 family peptidase [Streptosporangium pseudovulgare]|uniref:NlpC/P60 domain-containing protein n=1 Tax=Streptosporangium pseudovulgare TaxID=35765 RepID=A0ABQ2QMT1_9ACTN|nr:C40 family peptidase [Streptosporangium pseudovulgare]GGP87719.1 hypothetical protein GCM10010140_16410 [Streptosporangium pseudovulgare]
MITAFLAATALTATLAGAPQESPARHCPDAVRLLLSIRSLLGAGMPDGIRRWIESEMRDTLVAACEARRAVPAPTPPVPPARDSAPPAPPALGSVPPWAPPPSTSTPPWGVPGSGDEPPEKVPGASPAGPGAADPDAIGAVIRGAIGAVTPGAAEDGPSHETGGPSGEAGKPGLSPGPSSVISPRPRPVSPAPSPRSRRTPPGRTAVAAALRQLGRPYVWGGGSGAGPTGGGFDCSGLALHAWSRAGVALTHYTGSQFRQGRRVPFSRLRAGDLVFFGGGTGDPTHVGIYVKGGVMVHAPKTGDVVRMTNFAASPYYRARYRGAVRPGPR